MRIILTLLTLFQFTSALLVADGEQKPKRVLLAIIAHNQEHVLPKYLSCIENLDYPKSAITVYINTDMNVDRTTETLEKWADKNRYLYRSIIFDDNAAHNHFAGAHQNLKDGTIKNTALQLTKTQNCDFFFISDCDNFIQPYTLTDLVAKDKTIIAPMLKAFPVAADPFSNFFSAVDANGYYAHTEEYTEILGQKKKGTFQLPVVSRTYLVKSDCIDKLGYLDGSLHNDFIVFSRTARKNGVFQYLTNEKDYGCMLHLSEGVWKWPPEKK